MNDTRCCRKRCRFSSESRGSKEDTINNRVNNDFFGEICDFKIGYFAGKPISYSYNRSEDSKADTGGEEAVGRANKVLADFVYLNSFPDVDMEVTKFATVCGYSGRLLYHDPEGRERAMPTPPWETILLSEMGRYHGAGFCGALLPAQGPG